MMLFKKAINTTVYINEPLLIIQAVCNNKICGKMICMINEEAKTISISDIECQKNNKGYGSLMMKQLIEYAEQNRFECIDGWLSEVDRNHEKRLYYFYGKFGFKIIPNKEGMKFADIKLVLIDKR